MSQGAGHQAAHIMDVSMLTLVNGRERTLRQFQQMFSDTGFRFQRVIPTASHRSDCRGRGRLNRERTDGCNGKTGKKWTKIGAAFPHKEGVGFNIELKAFPIDGRLVALPPDTDDGNSRNGK
jgi:hypothetical protein